MKKITYKDLLGLEGVLFAPFLHNEGEFQSLTIKHSKGGLNNWFVAEDFPILKPDIGCNYCDSLDRFKELQVGQSTPISTLETYRWDYYYQDHHEFLLYEREDILKLIEKLSSLL